ncbi:MAG: RHS repeat protein, partial [Roseiflexus sp.]|nr:RHS repeat protein [Roseiflexus sp.]
MSGGHSYAYDANGNMVSRTTGGQSFTLTYDAENRLVSVSGAVIATFVYDLFITHKSNRHVDPEEHVAGATTSPHYHPTGANHARSFAPPAR